MNDDFAPRRKSSWRVMILVARCLIVASAVWMAGMAAYLTRPNAHPDEQRHVAAFEYFSSHWLRPPIDSDQLIYSFNGVSRVYNGEIVYFLYGRIGWIVKYFSPNANPYHIYRFCNVALLLITLSLLVFYEAQWFSSWLLALFLICIPQVIYVYSYANSDAFGVSMSILFFAWAARMLRWPSQQWSFAQIAPFMLLFLLTLLSKIAFELDIVLPLALLIADLFRCRAQFKMIVPKLIIPLLVVYVFAAWWNPKLSPYRGEWNRQIRLMHEHRAMPGRRPSNANPTSPDFGRAPGVFLAAHGWTYQRMIDDEHHWWLRYTGQSVYGQFGYMSVVLPTWIYLTAAGAFCALFLVTLASLIARNQAMHWALMLCLIASPILIVINFYGSLYHSLYVDLQPQGRYLFACLVPLFFLCLGTWCRERWPWRLLHALPLALLLPLAFYVFIEFVVLNPALRG